MAGRIFDTHAHYYDEKFDGLRDNIICELENSAVCGVINCGINIETSIQCAEYAENNELFYAAVGYHPEEITDKTFFEREKLVMLAEKRKVVAIGEIGLDYYWSTEFKQNQIDFFIKQLELANELDMPVIIHDREAHGDTLSIVSKHKPKGVMHCFSGSRETANEIIKLGMYIGIGGCLTFKNSKKLRETAEKIPLERILLETDAPYMAPEPHRGKINRSDYIIFVAQKLAEIKSITVDEVLKTTEANARTLFNI
ncbi:MAG: TatD family hydrolase [Clostridiales bacterium]|nr:TatD family hydrolase [Candidatus Equinaster intestinalis]